MFTCSEFCVPPGIKSSYITMILKLVLFICIFTICSAENRKISLFINPGCGSECKDNSNVLIHVKSDGNNDTLHHIWDFTSKPTVILAQTPLNTDLKINWTSFLKYEEGAIQFSASPSYTFSFILNKVIEFNDVNNTAIYDSTVNNSSYSIIYKTNFKWILDKYVNTTDYCSVVMRADHEHQFRKGSMSIMLSTFGTMEHSDLQPHLLHTTNASQIDIQLEELPTTKHFKSRFALGFVLVSSDPANATMNQENRKSFDDEHSPGIFSIGEVKSKRGYLEWRSVAYTSSKRLMTNSTGVKSNLVDLPDNKSFGHTALSSLFGANLESMLRKGVYVSFGEAGDSLYSANPYISWSFLGGIGVPGNEGLSLLILLIVAFGLGIPAFLIFIGAICIVVKKMSRQGHDIVFAES